jgi:uncharacterized membrane protein
MKNNMNTQIIFQLLSVLATGLIAGLFYGYSCSVNQGLGNLPDEKYLEAFQSIDRAIQNPAFLSSFLGSAVLLPIVTILVYKTEVPASFFFLVSATIIYFTGVIGITVFCNVPLNEQLAKFSISTATADEISAMRQVFEKPWNRFHSIRTIASIIAFSFTILSIIKQKI